MHKQEEITWDDLLSRFDPSVHDALRRVAALPGTTHLAVFENQLFDSSRLGERTAVAVGPARDLKTLEAAYTTRLGRAVSDMQIPIAHAKVPT